MRKLLSAFLIVLLLSQGLFNFNVSAIEDDDIPIKMIVPATSRTFFITLEGKVLASGSNQDGMLGLGSSALFTDNFVELPNLAHIRDIAIAAGKDDAYFITENGDVYSTGIGVKISTAPIKIPELSNIDKIAADGNSIIFLKTNGEVYVYGDNSKGQLGGGNTVNFTTITKLSGVSGVKDVQMGDKFAVFLFDNGTVKVTGYDADGRLGLNNSKATTIKTLTALYGNPSDIQKIAVGRTHVLYLRSDNKLYATADRGNPIGAENSSNDFKKITEVKKFNDTIGTTGIKDISASTGSYALLNDGTVWTVGYNPYGASYTGNTLDNTDEYVKVAGDVLAIFVGGNQTMMGKKNADITAAGKNTYGEIPIGSHGGNVLNPVVLKGMYYAYGTRTTTQAPTENVVQNGLLNFKYAVLTDSIINLEGSAAILGDAATNNGDVTLIGGTRISGNLFLGHGAKYALSGSAAINGTVGTLNPKVVLNMPEFAPLPNTLTEKGTLTVGNWPTQNVTINQDGCYDSISLVSNGTLTIDVGSGVRKLRVRNLNITQGNINLTGTGTLYLYLDKPFSMGGSSTFNSAGDSSKLQIYIDGAGTVSLAGSSQLKGCLYGSQANLNIVGSSKITGNVILGGKNISLSGATPLTGGLYVPNATVTLTGSSNVRGAIVADKYYGTGATVVTHEVITNVVPSDFILTPVIPTEPTEPDDPTGPVDPNTGEDSGNTNIEKPFEDTVYDELEKLDYELIFNVATDGKKKLGESLGAYQRMLENVDSSGSNKSLKRVSKLVDIFGLDSEPLLQYGTYNLYEE